MDFLVNIFSKLIMFLNGYVDDYGWALVLLGIITKLIILPLYVKQIQVSIELSEKMKKIKPYITKLQEKYGNTKDPQVMQELYKKQMELYQNLGFNPIGGCFTSIVLSFIQLPILAGVFFAVKKEIDILNNVSFLWVKSLAKPDMILFLLYVLSMYISFKTMPSSYDDEQSKKQAEQFQIIMLLMFSILFFSFPSAFILYWLAFNLTSIPISIILYRIFKPKDLTQEQLEKIAKIAEEK
jgi:YidC/Oxa1 family membrane protein insertase